MGEKKGKINCDISYSAYERSSNRNPGGTIRSFLGRRAFSPKVNRSGKLKGQNLFWLVCNTLNQQKGADITQGFPCLFLSHHHFYSFLLNPSLHLRKIPETPLYFFTILWYTKFKLLVSVLLRWKMLFIVVLGMYLMRSAFELLPNDRQWSFLV